MAGWEGLGVVVAAGGVLALIWLLWRRQVQRRESEDAKRAVERSQTLLKHALWGSQAELWDADLISGDVVRHDPLEHLAITAEQDAAPVWDIARWVHRDDLGGFRQALLAHLKGQSEYLECSYRTRDVDGCWRWMLTRGRVLERDAAGRAIRMVGTTFDISELRASQEATRESEERLKLAQWGSGDELWDMDLVDGRVSRENPLPMTALGAELSFPRIDDYLKYVHPEDAERLHSTLRAAVRGETPSFICSYRILARDAGWLWIIGKGRVVSRDDSGLALRMVGTNRDITALKQTEESLQRLNEELEQRVAARTAALEQSNGELQQALERLQLAQSQLVEVEKMAALGGLVAGVAHEINTPLGVGLTAASHLQQESRVLRQALEAGTLGKQRLAAYVDTAEQSAALVMRNIERADQLVRSFKQVAVDQSSEQRRVIALDAYLQEILQSLNPRLKNAGMALGVSCPSDLLLDTYPGAIYQIVVNLVMNALTHAFDGRDDARLDIEVVDQGERVSVSFRDNGCGMSEAVRRRVFEPFFTTRRGQGGSGLGLHIVYNLATQLLGGSVRCDSTPGAGTRVEVMLARRAPSRG